MTHIVTAENPSCGHHGYTVDLGPDSIVITCDTCMARSKNLHFTKEDEQ